MGYLDDKLTTCIGELYLISPPENWWLEFTESRAPDVGGSTESAERLVFLMTPTAWVSHNKTPCQLEYVQKCRVVGTFTAGLEDVRFFYPSFHHKKRATVGLQCVPDHGNTIFFPPIENIPKYEEVETNSESTWQLVAARKVAVQIWRMQDFF